MTTQEVYSIETEKEKKRKRKKVFLITSNEDFSGELTLQIIKERIVRRMAYYIGKENAISHYSLFEYTYGISPYRFNIYQRIYYWNVIKKLISKLRMNKECFIIIRAKDLFVLKTEEELITLQNSIKSKISGLKEMEKIAIEWIKNKTYITLKKS